MKARGVGKQKVRGEERIRGKKDRRKRFSMYAVIADSAYLVCVAGRVGAGQRLGVGGGMRVMVGRVVGRGGHVYTHLSAR